jgi:beta-galactosidase/beta-glucuronidase
VYRLIETVNATVTTSDSSSGDVTIAVIDRSTNATVATHTAATNAQTIFTVDSVKLWSPDSPNLYDIEITLGDDKVSSYTGFRTISRGVVNGVERPLLNGEFVFTFGTLDQGFW